MVLVWDLVCINNDTGLIQANLLYPYFAPQMLPYMDWKSVLKIWPCGSLSANWLSCFCSPDTKFVEKLQQLKCTMETFTRPECQICFNSFSPQRRPKLLECRHTCCSVCLDQMVVNHRDVRCPWCRRVTHLSGLSVFQLPDDPEALAAITLTRAPVFIRLPNSSCYLLPLSVDEHTYRYGFKNLEGTIQPEHLTAGEEEEVEGRDVTMKSSAWTGFCTVLLVAVILIFLLAIVLHNMSCVSKRFSIISCGWSMRLERCFRYHSTYCFLKENKEHSVVH